MAGRREEIEAERADPAEIWGRRVGRGFGCLAVILLLIYLAVTHAFV